MMRIDHRFSDRHSVSLIGRPTWNERNNYNGPWGPSRLEGYYDLPYAPHINLQDDFICGPNLLNKFTFGSHELVQPLPANSLHRLSGAECLRTRIPGCAVLRTRTVHDR